MSLEVDKVELEELASAWWPARWLLCLSIFWLDFDTLEGSTSLSALPLLALRSSSRSAIERSLSMFQLGRSKISSCSFLTFLFSLGSIM